VTPLEFAGARLLIELAQVAQQPSTGLDITPIIAALLGVLGGGTITSLLLIRRQKEGLVTEASERAVNTMRTAMDALSAEAENLRHRVTDLEAQLSTATSRRRELEEELYRVRRRLEEVEARLRRYRDATQSNEPGDDEDPCPPIDPGPDPNNSD
jgi:LPXTG-motif cell wall-anchored protein